MSALRIEERKGGDRERNTYTEHRKEIDIYAHTEAERERKRASQIDT